jgi:hypothetical protein
MSRGQAKKEPERQGHSGPGTAAAPGTGDPGSPPRAEAPTSPLAGPSPAAATHARLVTRTPEALRQLSVMAMPTMLRRSPRALPQTTQRAMRSSRGRPMQGARRGPCEAGVCPVQRCHCQCSNLARSTSAFRPSCLLSFHASCFILIHVPTVRPSPIGRVPWSVWWSQLAYWPVPLQYDVHVTILGDTGSARSPLIRLVRLL